MKITDLLVENKNTVADLFRDHEVTMTNLIDNAGSLDLRGRRLHSLRGCPKKVRQHLMAQGNQLTSLEGSPEEVGQNVYLEGNPIITLRGVHEHLKLIGGIIIIDGEKIKSHVLGLMLIKGLKHVLGLQSIPWMKCVNKYLPNMKGREGMFMCQEELIIAGLEKHAQL